MKASIKLVLFVLLFVFSSAELAFAKRGIRIPLFIRLPGPDAVVKVIELPDTPFLRRSDGTYVDIGYLHHNSSKGEWVGYVGSSTKYVSLSETNLKLLMKLGNVAQLPPPPAYNAGWRGALGNYGFYFLILGAVLGFAALKAVVTAVLRANRSETYRKEPQNNLEAAMAAAVKQNQSQPAAASATSFGAASGAQPMSFGKRA